MGRDRDESPLLCRAGLASFLAVCRSKGLELQNGRLQSPQRMRLELVLHVTKPRLHFRKWVFCYLNIGHLAHRGGSAVFRDPGLHP